MLTQPNPATPTPIAEALITNAMTTDGGTFFHYHVVALRKANELTEQNPIGEQVAQVIIDNLLEVMDYTIGDSPRESSATVATHQAYQLAMRYLATYHDRTALQAMTMLHDDMGYFLDALELTASEQDHAHYTSMLIGVEHYLDWANTQEN